MRLTLYSDYALRVLVFVALKEKAGRATVQEIASSYGISRNHVTKIVHELGHAGYLLTIRGKSGGIRLARPAAEIGVGEVLRWSEGDMALVDCFDDSRACCPISGMCVLRGALHEALAAFLEVLDRYTLADLVRPDQALGAALGLVAPPAAGITKGQDDG